MIPQNGFRTQEALPQGALPQEESESDFDHGQRSAPAARGKWARAGVPHKGWRVLDIDDLEEPSQVCGMCEFAMVRYIHTVVHPEYPDELEVGCICASHMVEGYNAREAEEPLRRTASRRTRWLKRKWRTSERGNSFVNTRDGFHVVVWQNGDRSWGGRVEDRSRGGEIVSRRKYQTESQAKLASLRAIEVLKRGRAAGESSHG